MSKNEQSKAKLRSIRHIWELVASHLDKAQWYSLEARFTAEGRVMHDRLARATGVEGGSVG